MTLTLSCVPPQPDRAEILRYAGARQEDEVLSPVLDECLAQILDSLIYKACYRTFPIHVCENSLDLGFAKVTSKALARALDGCSHVILMAATVGLSPDRLMARYATLSPTKALLFQAIGTERIEALCDTVTGLFAAQYLEKGARLRPRFSPGYGDLPLSLQREIFAALEPARHIGLSLNESLLMSPTKSVTALIGIAEHKELS